MREVVSEGMKEPCSEDAMMREFAASVIGEDRSGSLSGHGVAVGGGRSQLPSEELSSHMFQPRWHRLLRAMGEMVSRRIEESCSMDVPCEAARKLSALIGHADGVGGGSVEDVSHFLEGLLVKSHLNDTDAGFVLLHCCHHVQSGDLMWSSATWRYLLLVASLVAVHEVCAEGAREEAATTKMLAHVSHWWPQAEIKEAREAFVERNAYKRTPLTRSALAKLYFELRDQGLHLTAEASSNASAVFLSEAFDSRREPPSADFPRSRGSGLDDSGMLSVSSLRLSESSSSFSFSGSALPEDRKHIPKGKERDKKKLVSL